MTESERDARRDREAGRKKERDGQIKLEESER